MAAQSFTIEHGERFSAFNSEISSSTAHNIIKRFRESAEIPACKGVTFDPSGSAALKTAILLGWISENHRQNVAAAIKAG